MLVLVFSWELFALTEVHNNASLKCWFIIEVNSLVSIEYITASGVLAVTRNVT